MSCRIKPKKFLLLVFVVEFQFYFTGLLKVYVTVFLLKKYLTSKIEKSVPHVFFFLQFYELPDLGKKMFTTWNVLKSEVYLTRINFWKFHDDLTACLEVLDSQVDLKMWNLVSKCDCLRFWPPEKSVFELMTNGRFSFSESGPGRVHTPPKPVFSFKFSNF